MVRKLVSKSIPIVHHVTIPCSESLLISSSEGTVAMKVSGLLELGTLLLLLRVVLYLPTYFVFFNVLFPVCVSALFEIRDYLPYGCLFSAPLWHISLHFLHHPLICIGTFQCLLPLHQFNALKGFLGVEAGNFLGCEQFLFLLVAIDTKSSQESFIS